MRTFGIIALSTSLWLAASGCSSDEQKPATTTSAVRGVATYDVESSALRTSVIGRDPQGHEVLRLDVTHGRIPVTADIREFYPKKTEVDGRRFDLYFEGQNVWLWTVANYEGRYTLPAPNGDSRIRAFLEEPHVKAVLDQWRLGFDFPAATGSEQAYTSGTNAGTSPVQCTGTTCGNPRSGGNAIKNCGNGVAPISGVRHSHTTGGGYAYNEWVVTQFCPAGSGGRSYNWIATKTCPTVTSGQGSCQAGEIESSCGCVDGTDADDLCVQCNGGPQDASFYGSVTWTSTGAKYCYDATGYPNDCFGVTWAVDGGGTHSASWDGDYVDLTSEGYTGSHQVFVGAHPPTGSSVSFAIVGGGCSSSGMVGDLFDCYIDDGAPNYNWAEIQITSGSYSTNFFIY